MHYLPPTPNRVATLCSESGCSCLGNGLDKVVAIIHRAIYLSLLAQAATGEFIISYLWAPPDQVHVLIWNVKGVLWNGPSLSSAPVHYWDTCGRPGERNKNL